MTGLTVGMDTALQGEAVLAFGAIEILLPSAVTIRLIDGSGQVTFGGHTFVGHDSTYGELASVESISDGVDNSAPAVRITLMPPSDTAMATLADAAAQGSQVSIWFGLVVPSTGLVVADPDLIFLGELDVPTVKVGQNTRTLEYDVISAFERFFDQDEGVRLNDPFHESIWPGEEGFIYTGSVQQPMPWGQDVARPALISDIKTKSPYPPGGPYGYPGLPYY